MAVRKYEFDFLDLRPSLDAASFDPIEIQPVVPPSFTQEELDAAEQRAHAAGYATGEAAALSRAEMRLADTIERMSLTLGQTFSAQKATIADMEQSAARLTLACFQKLFPVFLAESGTVECEDLIARAFAQALEEPRLTLRCATEEATLLTGHLRTAGQAAGFDGKLNVIADAKLKIGDCRVEWSGGGIDRNASQLVASVEAAIRQCIETRQSPIGLKPAPSDPEASNSDSADNDDFNIESFAAFEAETPPDVMIEPTIHPTLHPTLCTTPALEEFSA